MKLKFRNDKERRAVEWFKRSQKRGTWLQRALEDVAYDPFHAGRDWREDGPIGFGMQALTRATWIRWNAAPYGHSSMNQMHQLARLCIRRNVYFQDLVLP